MKRIVLLLAGVIALSTTATAQKVTINAEKLLKNIAKSDEAIANPKKAEDPRTWTARAEAFYAADIEVSKNLYEGAPETIVQTMLGKPASKKTVEILSEKYNVRTYPPYVTAYFNAASGMLVAWEVTPIYEDAFDKAVEAYQRARELDVKGKNAKKIADGLMLLYNEAYKKATVEYNLAHYNQAGALFGKTYELGNMEGITPQDKDVLGGVARNAGLAYLLGATDYAMAKSYFELAISNGFEDEGNLYYLDYYAYRGEYDAMEDGEAKNAVMQSAQKMLEDGLAKYPSNEKIIECLTDAYVTLGEDPKNIINVVKQAVETTPDNASLWYGLARIYDSQKEWDNAIDAMKHMVTLQPKNAAVYYSIGLLYIHKADEIYIITANKTYSSQKEFDAAMKEYNDVYMEAVPMLEKAYELNTTDRSTLEMLKALTFRLRDLPGMLDKNKQYSDLLNAM